MTLDDLNEKEVNGPKVQAFSRCMQNNICVFKTSQDFLSLPEKYIGARPNEKHNRDL